MAFYNKFIKLNVNIKHIEHVLQWYLICERKGAVNIQPVVSLQLQERVSQQLLKGHREVRGHDLHVISGGRERRSGTEGTGWLQDWVQIHRRGTKSQVSLQLPVTGTKLFLLLGFNS